MGMSVSANGNDAKIANEMVRISSRKMSAVKPVMSKNGRCRCRRRDGDRVTGDAAKGRGHCVQTKPLALAQIELMHAPERRELGDDRLAHDVLPDSGRSFGE
jgi:hypothetical protein